MRMLVLESVTLDIQLTAFGCTATADLNQTAHAFSTLSQKDGAFELIHRYESRYLRAFERAGRNLMAYRKFRRQEAAASEPIAQEAIAQKVIAPAASTPAPVHAQPESRPSGPSHPGTHTENARNEPKPPLSRRERRLQKWQNAHPKHPQSSPGSGKCPV